MRRLASGVLASALLAACATTGPSGTSTLYSRLGGREGIAAALSQVLDEVLKDNTLYPYFVFQTTTPPPEPGHPTRAQIEGCLVELLSAVSGGPARYPVTLPDGYVCRDMKATHTSLGIGDGEMSLFVAIASKTLTALKVSPEDVTAVVGALESTRGDVVKK